MRRQGGNYGSDSGGGGAYGGGGGGAQLHQNSKSGYYQGRHQDQRPLRDKDGAQYNNQWRWEGDGAAAKLPQTAMSPTAPFSEGQIRDAPRSYYQSQRLDSQMPLESQDGRDPRSQSHEEDMDIGYEDSRVPPTLEGLEQRFTDDIMKLSKEQTDAEDAENARHRELFNLKMVVECGNEDDIWEPQAAVGRAREMQQAAVMYSGVSQQCCELHWMVFYAQCAVVGRATLGHLGAAAPKMSRRGNNRDAEANSALTNTGNEQIVKYNEFHKANS